MKPRLPSPLPPSEPNIATSRMIRHVTPIVERASKILSDVLGGLVRGAAVEGLVAGFTKPRRAQPRSRDAHIAALQRMQSVAQLLCHRARIHCVMHDLRRQQHQQLRPLHVVIRRAEGGADHGNAG